jgi:SAM-dependent methyltransferase
MITFRDMLGVVERPPIATLDLSAFGPRDLVNLILQRSEILRDQPRPGRIVDAWTKGEEGPAMALVETMGSALARRAAAFVWLEYQQLKPALLRLERRPRRVADIGCGFALFDLFLWRDFPGELVLIDLENTPERHFGFRDRGAAYADLEVARRFLADNGVPARDVTCLNPGRDALEAVAPVDLAVSFLSCGFHYPWQGYAPFFRDQLRPGGAAILDLRRRKAAAGRRELADIGAVSVLCEAAYGNAIRVMVRKPTAPPVG